MRKELLPDWAKKYKTKGYDVRYRSNNYVLYKITSTRVQGRKNPQPVQEYIGMITEKDGLLEKKRKVSDNQGVILEYGLSHYIYSNYRRVLQRSLFNITGDNATCIITLSIIYFIYGFIDINCLGLSYLSYNRKEELLSLYETIDKKRIVNTSNKIESLLKKVFYKESDYRLLIASLRQSTINYIKGYDKIIYSYPNIAIEIFNKYGVSYE